MVKILCRASLLKVDDVRLMSLPANEKFSSVCDLGAYDDAYHMIMQCPTIQLACNRMFDDLKNVQDGAGQLVLNSGESLLFILLGKHPAGAPDNVMIEFWMIAARHIADMYRSKTKRGSIFSIFSDNKL